MLLVSEFTYKFTSTSVKILVKLLTELENLILKIEKRKSSQEELRFFSILKLPPYINKHGVLSYIGMDK